MILMYVSVLHTLKVKRNSSAVSIANYDTLLNFKPKEGYPLNNLGVECRNVNLNRKSVGFYLRAVEEGNTLAMANLSVSLY